MANEITIPLRPCPSIDEVETFYEALGFRCPQAHWRAHVLKGPLETFNAPKGTLGTSAFVPKAPLDQERPNRPETSH